MSNTKYYIEKYKDFDKIIKTYYQRPNIFGKMTIVDDVVNPLKIDNRQITSVTDQQGNKPHCAAYSICNLCESVIWKRTGKLINLEADQVYALAKQIDGDELDGTYLESSIKAAMKLGGFDSKNVGIGFIENNEDNIIEKFKLAIHKYDFVQCGFVINEGWYDCNEDNPIINARGASLGGHAVLGVGYDETGAYIQNSWGKEWGAKGFCILPWEEFTKELMYACFVTNIYDNIG